MTHVHLLVFHSIKVLRTINSKVSFFDKSGGITNNVRYSPIENCHFDCMNPSKPGPKPSLVNVAVNNAVESWEAESYESRRSAILALE